MILKSKLKAEFLGGNVFKRAMKKTFGPQMKEKEDSDNCMLTSIITLKNNYYCDIKQSRMGWVSIFLYEMKWAGHVVCIRRYGQGM
jgi:hypothetical protein